MHLSDDSKRCGELLLKVESGEISVAQLENGELSEETLEQVAGGVAVAAVIGAIIAVVCYTGVAAGGAAVGVASYNLITGRRGW